MLKYNKYEFMLIRIIHDALSSDRAACGWLLINIFESLFPCCIIVTGKVKGKEAGQEN